jgi:hypothetical protein
MDMFEMDTPLGKYKSSFLISSPSSSEVELMSELKFARRA